MKSLDGKNTDDIKEIAPDAMDPAVEFSVRLVDALGDKSKKHNDEFPNSKSTLQQLKKVYIRGATSKDESLNLHGLARVNMYLRYKSGGKISTDLPEEQQDPSEIKGLVFDTPSSAPSVSYFLDITYGWSPEEEDYTKAKKDIEEYNLDYSFSNLDDVYLDSYEKLDFTWE